MKIKQVKKYFRSLGIPEEQVLKGARQFEIWQSQGGAYLNTYRGEARNAVSILKKGGCMGSRYVSLKRKIHFTDNERSTRWLYFGDVLTIQ